MKYRLIYTATKDLFTLKVKSLRGLKKNTKPKVINLNANDICNSKCTMCNIWKNKLEKEITDSDLKEIFTDSFYSDVEYVGITGGEPTLREDLVDLYKACIDYLPHLKGLSIITNCIKPKVVKNQLEAINKLCVERGVEFTVMVSLDGYGETHDRIRGVKGNFDTAIEVINYVRNDLKIPVSFGSTISKDNVWEIDELLDFAISNQLYGRFRVAEFIKRLYNDDRNDVIRNFTDEESYHLVLFFERLKRSYETESTYRRTYSSIQNILLGGSRTIGCPYHHIGINLNAKGELAYCAPKSKNLGSALSSSSTELYNTHLDEKRRLIKEECSDCIHDYHAEITYNEQLQIYKDKFRKKFFKLYSSNKVLLLSRLLKKPTLPTNAYTILIIGWYGTETVGDKAILGGIIERYKETYGDQLNIIVGSLFPFVTDQTIKELGVASKVISTSNFEFFRYAKVCDEVIMGGGPLMDLNELYVPLLSFQIAKKYNKKRTVYGCGIGPVIGGKYKTAINKILHLSNDIFLRDFNSVDYASNEFNIVNTKMIGDPAKGYLKQVKDRIVVKNENTLSVFLRDWEFAYGRQRWTEKEFYKVKINFEKGLSDYIKAKAEELKVDKISFNHMHNLVIGGDDRVFSRRFINEYFKDDERVVYSSKLSTVESIANQMVNSKFNVCMRFHSVLFAHTLNTDFAAVDYTLGGKIEAYMTQNDESKRLFDIKYFLEI